MSRSLFVEVSDLAKAQILAADAWWRVNRPKLHTRFEKMSNALRH